MSRRAALATLLAAFLLGLAAPARAHHGVAAVSAAGAEGPGAAIDTTSALPLASGHLLGLLKEEYVPFRQLAAAEPENKRAFSFTTLAVGYGLTPWLSAYAFQPFAVKTQETLGRTAGVGDTNLMLSLAAKWDGGLRLVPARESLDDLEDWHLLASLSATLPVGSTTRRDAAGAWFEPGMQSGFGETSPAVDLAATKQLSADLTLLLEANYQHFLAHRYPFTRYQFGDEVRLNAALAWRAWGAPAARLDLVGELNGLGLARDREDDGGGRLGPVDASGGLVLYAVGGARLTWGAVSAVLGVKVPVASALNERERQQGSEGLEVLRATASLSWSTGP